MANWNKRFIELSEHIATWSKDKSIGTCAIIVDKDNNILSTGYNGFPIGSNDNIPERYERPLKYFWTEHAERNAIYSAAKRGVSLDNTKMFLRWFPCSDCARAIIQSGIKKVICDKPDLTTPKWGEHFKITLEMFKECHIEVEYYDDSKKD